MKPAFQNTVMTYVAKSEDYNGMMQNNDVAEDSTNVILKELLTNKQDSLSQKTALKIYPNPFNNYISIQSPEKDQLILKSIEGKVIDNYKIDNGLTRVNTAALTSGMYILNFFNQNKSFKLIKR